MNLKRNILCICLTALVGFHATVPCCAFAAVQTPSRRAYSLRDVGNGCFCLNCRAPREVEDAKTPWRGEAPERQCPFCSAAVDLATPNAKPLLEKPAARLSWELTFAFLETLSRGRCDRDSAGADGTPVWDSIALGRLLI